ncbi:MAG: hypothetical protein IK130_07035 [Oscillospiraceae bacterium]|nr:hypothetical protein [Oscillospiraceae bacterium]
MSKLKEFTETIMNLLRRTGLTVYADYEHPAEPIPARPFFTVSPVVLTGEKSVLHVHGRAMAFTITLVLRLHTPAFWGGTFAQIMEEQVVPALASLNYDIRSMEITEPQYHKEIDRNVTEAKLVIGGLWIVYRN